MFGKTSKFISILLILLLSSCSKDDSTVAPSTTGTITGKIISSDKNEAIGGVNIFSTPATGYVTSDANGEYEIKTVQPGEYEMTAIKIGYDTLKINVSVSAGANTVADFILAEYDSAGRLTVGNIEGFVFNSVTLLPISQVNITTNPVTGSFVTASDGSFSIPSIEPGEYKLISEKVGFDAVQISISVREKQTTVANIFLVPPDTTEVPVYGSIEGKIVSSDSSTPIIDAVITTTPATHSITSGQDGTFKLSNLAPGSYTVKVAKDGFSLTSEVVAVEAGLTTQANIVLHQSTGSISGIVRDSNSGTVLSDVNIQTSPATFSVTTDNNGTYKITGIATGEYKVTATLSGYESVQLSIEVIAGVISQADVVMTKL